MGLTVLTFGDGETGGPLQAWVNEFVYAMGRWQDFDLIAQDRSETLVLALCCLPDEWPQQERLFRKGRGADREQWSRVSANYGRFRSAEPAEKLVAVAQALRDAIGQLPGKAISEDQRQGFIAALEYARLDLLQSPERHPRG
ncbi:MAG: hypothetical protein ACKOPG_11730 [Novosphingobium sp.]